MAITYNASCNNLATGAAANDIVWDFAKFLVAFLKTDANFPWTTRGSSRSGSSGTAFSATPDGVDHWVGRTQAQAATTTVWHVLQQATTGYQICIALNPVGGSRTWAMVLALSKFETAGAWRGGGSSSSVRPTDVTSSPTATQEVATGTGCTPSPQSVSNEYYNIVSRKDGKGFYAYIFRDTTPDASNDHFLTGFALPTEPDAADLNPWVVFTANGAAMGQELADTSTSHQSFVSKVSSGASETWFGMDWGVPVSNLQLDASNGWNSKFPVNGIYLRSNTTKQTKGFMPDIFVHGGGGSFTNFTTRNSKAYIIINNPSSSMRLMVPWDGSTTRGTDVNVFMIPTAGTTGPVTTSTDFKAFNNGLEKI